MKSKTDTDDSNKLYKEFGFSCDYSQKLPKAYEPRFFDLERFRRFLDEYGIPTKVPAIVIAGSKGKGTTAHILSRLLTAQGRKTGLFTSPYLYDIREMIRMDGRMIARGDFLRITREIFRLAKNFPGLTTFEILTATALCYFSQKKADFYVLEVGLGGLLDAVNVVTPIATVLTMVEREHADILGGTLLHIIRAKLGITRPGVPLFLGKQKKQVHELILKELRGRKVPVFDVGRDFSLKVLKMTEKGTSFQVMQREPFFLGLHGEAAGWNALTAAAVAGSVIPDRKSRTIYGAGSLHNARALRLLRRPAKVWTPRNDSIFPGHFEIRDLPNGKKLILDVFHTPESARNFRQTLERVFPNQPYVFIAAFLQDKNIPAILKHLIRPDDSVFFAKISHPRAESPQKLYKFFVQQFQNSLQPQCTHCNGKKVLPSAFSCETGTLSKIFKKIAQSDCQQKIFCLAGSHFLLREAKKQHFLL